MLGRLNSFQKAMLEWDALHSYNVVHVVRVAQALDFGRLRNIVRATLEARGLTGLNLDWNRGTYQYVGGPAQSEIQCVMDESLPGAALASEIERQLNTVFVRSARFDPFRFFVVPREGSFFLGLVYFHVVADAESIVLLLKEMVEAYSARM